MVEVALLVLVVGCVLALVGARSGAAARERTRAETRLSTLERTVDAIAAQLGVVVPEPEYPEVMRLLAQGQRVKAIKAYREATGADLVTAKNAVDELARRG